MGGLDGSMGGLDGSSLGLDGSSLGVVSLNIYLDMEDIYPVDPVDDTGAIDVDDTGDIAPVDYNPVEISGIATQMSIVGRKTPTAYAYGLRQNMTIESNQKLTIGPNVTVVANS